MLALIAFESRDRHLDRFWHGGVERAQQSQGSQQLDHRGHLHRAARLSTLDGRLTDPGLDRHLSLSEVALETMTLEPAAKLGENAAICGDLFDMHQT